MERTNYPSEKDDWKKLEKNNLTIAFNILYAESEKRYPAYVSKQKLKLDAFNGWHYLAVKVLSALLRGLTSKHYDGFYGLNCLHSFRIKANLDHIKQCARIEIFVML